MNPDLEISSTWPCTVVIVSILRILLRPHVNLVSTKLVETVKAVVV